MKAVWPDVPLLCYQEFFYNEFGFDSNFDPEFQDDRVWQEQANLTMKNAYLHLTLEQRIGTFHPPTSRQAVFRNTGAERLVSFTTALIFRSPVRIHLRRH